MLVLSRKAEQTLHLGDDITVTVLGIEGDRVKLGIEAPRAVCVLRHEVYLQIQAANAAAAAVAATRPSLHTIAAAMRGAHQSDTGAPSA
jgi:carbon storage regulator